MFSNRCLFRHNPLRNLNKDEGFTSIFRTIGFIGDSLSSGEHESFSKEKNEKSYHDYYEYSWGQYIARKAGLKGINFSRGGLTVKQFLDYSLNHNPLINNIFDEENKCQAYTIALGVNDMNHLDGYELGFGSLDDIDINDESKCKDSYIGQYARIILKLREIEPKCRIFLLTPTKEKPETKIKKEKYDKIEQFLVSLTKMFDYLYVINLRKYAPIYDKKWGKKYFLGGHMSALGYKMTADMVMTYIDDIIRHNQEDFAQVGFIGKGGIHNENHKW